MKTILYVQNLNMARVRRKQKEYLTRKSLSKSVHERMSIPRVAQRPFRVDGGLFSRTCKNI